MKGSKPFIASFVIALCLIMVSYTNFVMELTSISRQINEQKIFILPSISSRNEITYPYHLTLTLREHYRHHSASLCEDSTIHKVAMGLVPMWCPYQSSQSLNLAQDPATRVLWHYHMSDAYSSTVYTIFFTPAFGEDCALAITGNDLYLFGWKTGNLFWSTHLSYAILCCFPVYVAPISDRIEDFIVAMGNKTICRINSQDGTTVWSEVITYTPSSGSELFDDMNGDGGREVLIGDDEGYVYCLSGTDGAIIWNDKISDHSVVSISGLYDDVNDDGSLDLVAYTEGGYIYCLNGANGAVIWTSDYVGEGSNVLSCHHPLCVINIDGDDINDVVVCSRADNTVKGLSGKDGSFIWSQSIGGGPLIAKSLWEDIDGDGIYDLIIGTAQGDLYLLSGASGEPVWEEPFRAGFIFSADSLEDDANEGGLPDIIIGSDDGYAYLVSGESGVEIWSFNASALVTAVSWKMTWDIGSGAVDVDGDGINDPIIGTNNGDIYCLSSRPRYATHLSDPSTTTNYNDMVNIYTRLVDEHGNPVSNKIINFYIYYDSSWHFIGQDTTNSSGYANISYTPNLMPDNYQLKVTFEGDDYYEGSEQLGWLTINKENVELSDPSCSGYYSDIVVIITRLTDDEDNSIIGRTVYFEYYNGSSWKPLGDDQTNSSGYASIVVTLNMEPSFYNLRVRFEGDDYYKEAQCTGILTVNKEITTLADPSASVSYSDEVSIQTRLTDDEGNPISNKTIMFYIYYNESWQLIGSAVSDENGYASKPYSADIAPGDYQLKVMFEGDNYYKSSEKIGILTILKETTELNLTSISVNYGDICNITAWLKDDEGNPLEGKTVNFYVYYNNSWRLIGSAITNENGRALISYTPDILPGDYQIKASFDGDDYYGGSEFIGTLTVNKEITMLTDPSTGAIRYHNVTICTYLTDDEGNAIARRVVYFEYYDGSSWVLLSSSVTDETGRACITFNVTLEEGTYDLRVRFDGDNYYEPCSFTGTLTVTEAILIIEILNPIENSYVSGTVTISAYANCSLGIDRVEFYIDDELIYVDYEEPFEYTWDTANWPDGPHIITAKVYDTQGFWVSDSIRVIVDNTSPECSIIEPVNGSYVKGVVQISITAYDDNMETIKLYINDVVVASWNKSGSYTYYWNTTTYVDGPYTIKLVAIDKAGNALEVSCEVIVDKTPPTVNITHPSGGSYVKGTIEIRVEASDAWGIENVEFYIDGELVYEDIEAPYEYLWATTGYTEGNHTIRVIVYDRAGNLAEDEIHVIVDNTPPHVFIYSPEGGQLVNGTIQISFYGHDANIANISLYIDGELMETWREGGNYTYSWDTSNWPDGNHTIRVIAIDKADNRYEKMVEVLVDNHSPAIEIISPVEGEYVSGIYNISFNVQDVSLKKVELYIDEDLVATWSEKGSLVYSWNTEAYTDGSHVIRIIAEDQLDRITEVTINVIVDNTPPVIGEPHIEPEEPKAYEEVKVSVSVNDTLSGVERVILYYRVGGGEWKSIEMERAKGIWTATIPGQKGGVKVWYKIEAWDGAGNLARTDILFYEVKGLLETIKDEVEEYAPLAFNVTTSLLMLLVISVPVYIKLKEFDYPRRLAGAIAFLIGLLAAMAVYSSDLYSVFEIIFRTYALAAAFILVALLILIFYSIVKRFSRGPVEQLLLKNLLKVSAASSGGI